MDKPNNELYQSIVRPFETDDKSEDRVRVQQGLYAIADGAGGGGMYASEWAQCLVDHLPIQPITNASSFVAWLTPLQNDFNAQKRVYTEQHVPDAVEKFKREGSLSTLLVVWLNSETGDYHLLSYGDSAAFVLGTQFWCSLSYDSFMEYPYLVGCKENDATAKDPLFATGTLKKEDSLLLCSDTLAQYLLAAYLFTNPTPEHTAMLNSVMEEYHPLSQYSIDLQKMRMANKNFEADILLPLKQALASETDCKTYLYQLYNNKQLGADDYSIIIVN